MSTDKPTSIGAQDKASLEAAIERVARQIKELCNFDPMGIKDRWDSRIEGLQKRVNATLSDALGMGTPEYKKHAIRALDESLDTTFGDRYTLDELKQGLKQGVDRAISNLNAVKKLLTERLEKVAAAPAMKGKSASPAPSPTPSPIPTPSATPMPMPSNSKPELVVTVTSAPKGEPGRHVAIVCRVDEPTGKAVSAFVEQLGLEPFSVQTSAGQNLGSSIDRLDEVRGADYAIVLLGADDPGASSQGLRQEVLLEIGFLLGAVGRRRVCFLVEGQPALAPDLDAMIVRHAMDGAGLWRLLLAREMKQAGLDVDMNRAL